MMKKRRVMIDGAVAGAELVGSVDLESSEVSKIKRLLLKNGGLEKDSGLSVTVVGRSSMVVSLRTHYHNKNKFYLNITGNPLSFVTGSNTYGYAEADRVMITAYRMALESLEGSIPRRIMHAIANRQINVHSLEFATYTNKLKDKARLLNDWAHVYQTAYSSLDGLKHETLAELLNLRFIRAHKDHKSVCLRILSKDGREEEAMLMIYDKAEEMRDRARSDGKVAAVPSDIENRLRLDLSLGQGWFRRHQVNGRKLKTLADLAEYIEKRYEGLWYNFLGYEFEEAVRKVKLFEIWKFDAEAALKGSDRVYHAMLKARALMKVSDAEWNSVLKGRRVRNIDIDPHPEEIRLDMGIL